MTTANTISAQPRRRIGLVGPALLIGLGTLLLLDTIGWIGPEAWDAILNLWPVALIAIGLDLLLGRRAPRWSALVAVALLLAMAGTIWWSGTWGVGGTGIVNERIGQPLGGATRGDVKISMGAGTLQLGALSASDGLIAGTIAHRARNQVIRDYAVSGATGTLVLREDDRRAGLFSVRRGEDVVWDLKLNRTVPLDLTIATGAGRATLDLAALQVTGLRVETGVGTTTLALPATGRVQAQVSGGIGTTTIVIPAGMAARIEATAGIGSVNVAGTFARAGTVYTSAGYARANNRIDLRVNGGIGSINIQHAGGD